MCKSITFVRVVVLLCAATFLSTGCSKKAEELEKQDPEIQTDTSAATEGETTEGEAAETGAEADEATEPQAPEEEGTTEESAATDSVTPEAQATDATIDSAPGVDEFVHDEASQEAGVTGLASQAQNTAVLTAQLQEIEQNPEQLATLMASDFYIRTALAAAYNQRPKRDTQIEVVSISKPEFSWITIPTRQALFSAVGVGLGRTAQGIYSGAQAAKAARATASGFKAATGKALGAAAKTWSGPLRPLGRFGQVGAVAGFSFAAGASSLEALAVFSGQNKEVHYRMFKGEDTVAKGSCTAYVRPLVPFRNSKHARYSKGIEAMTASVSNSKASYRTLFVYEIDSCLHPWSLREKTEGWVRVGDEVNTLDAISGSTPVVARGAVMIEVSKPSPSEMTGDTSPSINFRNFVCVEDDCKML